MGSAIEADTNVSVRQLWRDHQTGVRLGWNLTCTGSGCGISLTCEVHAILVRRNKVVLRPAVFLIWIKEPPRLPASLSVVR
jgi:hypothetical protein